MQRSLLPLVAGTKDCKLLVRSSVQLCPNGHGIVDGHLPCSNRPAGPRCWVSTFAHVSPQRLLLHPGEGSPCSREAMPVFCGIALSQLGGCCAMTCKPIKTEQHSSSSLGFSTQSRHTAGSISAAQQRMNTSASGSSILEYLPSSVHHGLSNTPALHVRKRNTAEPHNCCLLVERSPQQTRTEHTGTPCQPGLKPREALLRLVRKHVPCQARLQPEQLLRGCKKGNNCRSTWRGATRCARLTFRCGFHLPACQSSALFASAQQHDKWRSAEPACVWMYCKS